MLDRNKLAGQIINLATKLFPDLKDQSELAQKTWDMISKDESFLQRVERANCSLLVPSWQGNLNDSFKLDADIKKYSVLSVDGSQVYPDRHLSGAGCFLINTGGCFLEYGSQGAAKFHCEPKIFLPEDLFNINDKIKFSMELVDLLREGLELKKMFDLSVEFRDKSPVCFVDGSLVFWFLESRQQEVKDLFLNKYLYYLNKFYENNMLIAGFISFPKSKELVNLVKLGLCRFSIADCPKCHKEYDSFGCNAVDGLIDTTITRSFLGENCRTTVFYSRSKIVKDYPDHLKPCFLYLNIGAEIVRIEVPYWIAQDVQKLNLVCKVAIDQSLKGRGYPVVLAEAHEQAVVKGPDREFFYHLIQKVGIEKKKRFFVSQKSLKKRGMGI